MGNPFTEETCGPSSYPPTSGAGGPLQQLVDGVDDSVGGWDVGRDDVAVVDLHLAVGLLQGQRGPARHRVLDLVEAHASGEQGALHQVFRDELLSHLLVGHQVGQFLGGEFREGVVRGRKDGVGLDTCRII